jgi:hypothetical protein
MAANVTDRLWSLEELVDQRHNMSIRLMCPVCGFPGLMSPPMTIWAVLHLPSARVAGFSLAMRIPVDHSPSFEANG